MENICNKGIAYTGISSFYQKWCTGDEEYLPSLKFYTEFLAGKQGKIMELGIGTGRIALAIIEKYPVRITGVDRCTAMLEQCSYNYQMLMSKGQCFGTLNLIQQDMCSLSYFEEFDVVYLPFRTVGHLLSNEELEKMFVGVYNALKQKGFFVLDHYIFQREWAEEHHGKDIIMYEDAELKIKDCYYYDFEHGMMECFVKVNEACVEHFKFRWIEPETIREIAVRVGFYVENLLGEFDGSEFSEDSFNQIWILRK